jgi:NAD(P)-dependent dehydrogenase (short-subunit alcohol dehydrogenase family)
MMARAPRTSPDRVALVTGAGDRIGATIAKRLAAAGHKVVIHYRSSLNGAKAVLSEITKAGGDAALVKADLTRRKDRAALIGKAAAAFGPLTVLINNASIYERDSALDVDEALWDEHFALHAEAPVFLSRDFARQLPEGTAGNIVNIIDERVVQLSPGYLSYTLSKSVLWTATRTLAQSLAPRIRVNSIGPGPTLKPAGKNDADFKAAVARLPLERGANPDDIADGILYILGAASMTGQMLALDGGEHLEWPQRRGPTARK